jgi:hypothetical protein
MPDLWDAEALDAIIAYGGSLKQVWDNTEIDGPWLDLMRNSLNTQIFSFQGRRINTRHGRHDSDTATGWVRLRELKSGRGALLPRSSGRDKPATGQRVGLRFENGEPRLFGKQRA